VHDRRFGVSTQLFLDSRLTLAHLVEISASGIEAVEVFGSRSHFDYSDLRAPTAAMMATQKVGYDGVVRFDTPGDNDPADVLRRRLDRMFVTF
jgi:hypothetical protein